MTTATTTTWAVTPDYYAAAVLRLDEVGAVPVLVHEGGYPTATHPDGRTTAQAPHVSVALYGSAGVRDGNAFRSWREAIVTAVGRYDQSGRRRVLTVATVPAADPSDRGALIAAALEHVDAAVAAVGSIDATYDAAEARIAEGGRYVGRSLSREAYEAACAEAGVPALPDADCAGYAVRYGDFRYPQYGAEKILTMALAYSRLRAIDADRAAAEAATPEAPPPALHAWGSRGVRYDEPCEVCHRTGEVDNGTNACRAHHALAGAGA